MENFVLVRPEHLNHHGNLFGGVMIKWVDEFAWITATRDYPGCMFVTIGMDRIEFRHGVPNGSILRFSINPDCEGTTSVTYHAEVYSRPPGGSKEQLVFTTGITFVRIDEAGGKCPLPRKTDSE